MIKENLQEISTYRDVTSLVASRKEDWEAYWQKKFKPRALEHIVYEEIFLQYLHHDSSKTCIEIGCIPGDFLIFMHKNFGYRIAGIDFNGRADLLWQNMRFNGINECQYYEADFTTWKTDQRFDIVCSFGFIEHFKDSEAIISKHISLLSDEGMLILGCPNFRFGQFVFHKIFDEDNIKKHNLKIMDLGKIKSIIEAQGLSVIYLGYYGTVQFWVEDLEQKGLIKRWIAKTLIRITNSINIRINLPTHYFSPYILCIAQR